MNPSSPSPEPPKEEPPKPFAYDSEGRPLYASPPSQAAGGDAHNAQPQFVHFRRAVNPAKQELSPDIQARHQESVRRFPFLNLSESEFVVSAIRRHPVGLVLPVGVTVFLVALTASLAANYQLIADSLGVFDPPPFESIFLISSLFIVLFLLGGYAAVWVYMNNKFFLTNESVIQEIQHSLFSRHEQTVSLVDIEDASYRQQGVLQALLDYGSIRLSTEGDETTYRFRYVSNPKQQIAILNNAVEAFKNGRPITEDQ